jgi:hypothetical protein
MKKIVTIIFFTHVFIFSALSQEYDALLMKGKDLFDKGDYSSALEQFIRAYDVADTDSMETEADSWKTKSLEKIKVKLAETDKIKKNASDALRIALNEHNNSGKKVYEICKNKGISNYNKKLYFDAIQMLKMSKLSPDYENDAEIDNYITKSKSALDTLKKIALVIGNANYVEVNMQKAITDAKDVSKALASMNFTVMEGFNLKSGEFDALVKKFFWDGQKYDIAFFFFTGFGYNSDNMLPVDTKTDDAGNLKKWFSLNYLMNEFPKNFTTKKIFVLDIDRTSKEGVPPSVLQYRNTLVMYSAAPNNGSFNGVGRNSLFTEQFLKYLTMQNTPFQEIFRLTREATKNVSKDRQVPTIYDNIQNNVYLNLKLD